MRRLRPLQRLALASAAALAVSGLLAAVFTRPVARVPEAGSVAGSRLPGTPPGGPDGPSAAEEAGWTSGGGKVQEHVAGQPRERASPTPKGSRPRPAAAALPRALRRPRIAGTSPPTPVRSPAGTPQRSGAGNASPGASARGSLGANPSAHAGAAPPLAAPTTGRPSGPASPTAPPGGPTAPPEGEPAALPEAAPPGPPPPPAGPGSRPPQAPVLSPPVPLWMAPPDHPGGWRVVVEPPGLAAGARVEAAAARVRVRVTVGADGHVTSVVVAVSSGRPELDEAALAAARRWRFLPARQDGAPVASVVLVWITFLPPP